MRRDLRRLLLRAFEASGGKIAWNSTIFAVAHLQDANHQSVRVRLAEGGSMECDLLVGADGISSRVRRARFESSGGPAEADMDATLRNTTSCLIVERTVLLRGRCIDHGQLSKYCDHRNVSGRIKSAGSMRFLTMVDEHGNRFAFSFYDGLVSWVGRLTESPARTEVVSTTQWPPNGMLSRMGDEPEKQKESKQLVIAHLVDAGWTMPGLQEVVAQAELFNAEMAKRVDVSAIRQYLVVLARQHAESAEHTHQEMDTGVPIVLVGDALHGGSQGGASWAICDGVHLAELLSVNGLGEGIRNRLTIDTAALLRFEMELLDDAEYLFVQRPTLKWADWLHTFYALGRWIPKRVITMVLQIIVGQTLKTPVCASILSDESHFQSRVSVHFLRQLVHLEEGWASLQFFGVLRIIYAGVWIVYRLTRAGTPPHLMGHPNFLFMHSLPIGTMHTLLSAALLPLVAVQLFASGGTNMHIHVGRLVMALTVAATPWCVALLVEWRYYWWFTTWVELLVLTQWLYHLHGLVVAASCAAAAVPAGTADKSAATADVQSTENADVRRWKLNQVCRQLHSWHALQFIRVWMTPVDVRIATSLTMTIGITDSPSIASLVGHLLPCVLWFLRMSPCPNVHADKMQTNATSTVLRGGIQFGLYGGVSAAAVGLAMMIHWWTLEEIFDLANTLVMHILPTMTGLLLLSNRLYGKGYGIKDKIGWQDFMAMLLATWPTFIGFAYDLKRGRR
eukprot:SAG31_NODE_3737_length_3936_cov_2.743028_1_plen_734_part_00